MRTISAWVGDHNLWLALKKVKVDVSTKIILQTILPMRVGDEELETKPASKYFGVQRESCASENR